MSEKVYVKKVLEFLKTEFLYNGHLQSLGFVSIAYVSTLLILNRSVTFNMLLSVYLLFELIFLFDRYKHIDRDRTTNPERTSHLEKYKDKMPFILSMILILLAILLFFSFPNINSMVFSFIVLLLGILYPLYFKGLTRKITLFKNVYVSLVHSLMVIFPLVYYSAAPRNLEVLMTLSGLIFFGSMMSQVILDTKDITVDKHSKLLTFPVMVNKDKMIKILVVVSVLVNSFFVIVTLISNNYLLLSLVIENIFTDFILIKLISNTNKVAYFLAAGRFIPWSFIILSIKIVQVVI